MDGTIRVRTAAWFATAVVVSVFATLLVMQQWQADAAAGDDDATWVPIEPCRLFDHRPDESPSGGRKTPLVAGSAVTQQVTGTVGNCVLPTTGVVGVSLNVTAVNGTAQSNLRLYPADAAVPLVSNMNWKAGDSPVANKVDVKLSSAGEVKLLNHNGTVDVVGDVVGYYTNATLKQLAGSTGPAGPAGPAGPSTELPPVGLFTPTQIVKDAILTCDSTDDGAECSGPKINGLRMDFSGAGQICLTVYGTAVETVTGLGIPPTIPPTPGPWGFNWDGSNWTIIRLGSTLSMLTCEPMVP